MATCEECLHNDVCYMQEVCEDIEEQLREFGCDNFKPKVNYARIIRCEECGYRNVFECRMRFAPKNNDFCSYGRSKDNIKANDVLKRKYGV